MSNISEFSKYCEENQELKELAKQCEEAITCWLNKANNTPRNSPRTSTNTKLNLRLRWTPISSVQQKILIKHLEKLYMKRIWGNHIVFQKSLIPGRFKLISIYIDEYPL